MLRGDVMTGGVAGSSWFEDECSDLQTLAERLAQAFPFARRYLGRWQEHFERLDASETRSTWDAEQRLDALATSLRQICLRTASLYSMKFYRSPLDSELPMAANGESLDFGYERDIRPESLEDRLRQANPAGLESEHFLFSSGQAALTALVMAGSWRDANQSVPLVLHTGSYFETSDLLRFLEHAGVISVLKPGLAATSPQIHIMEPVHCAADGEISAEDEVCLRAAINSPGAAIDLVIIDTTLCQVPFSEEDLAQVFHGFNEHPVVAVFRSGLKLDQAGLELSNVGVVSLYAGAGACGKTRLEKVAANLKRFRTLTGGGLGFEQINSLSVPWFLDPLYRQRYAGAVFDNNATFAQRVASSATLDVAHASLVDPSQECPFCTIRIMHGSDDSYRRLEAHIENETRRRGILLRRGGSFGFRGHRYQVIFSDEGAPFIRLAIGARRDASFQALIPLFNEISTDGWGSN